ALGQEDGDRDSRGNCTPDHWIQPEHGIKAQTSSANVADVENHAADEHESGQHPTQTREERIGKFVHPKFDDPDHTPDVELDKDIDHDRYKDGKGESRAKLHREDT